MGKATIPLYSVQAGTATVRVEYTDAETGLVDASTELAIEFRYALMPAEQEPKPATIEFISADPETIKIFNTSSEGQTSTKITFQVLDKLNLPIAGQQIYFSTPRDSQYLGTTLVPTETKSDVNGYAVTYLTSGRVAGIAEVIAGTEKYNEDTSALTQNYVAGAAKIHVVAGSANYSHFSVKCEQPTIGGFAVYGLQQECTAYVADRDTQEIPNQPVMFAAEAGAVFPLIYTGSNGQAITTYTTQDPIPFPVTPSPAADLANFYAISGTTEPAYLFLKSINNTILLDNREIYSSNSYADYENLYDKNFWEGAQDLNPRDGLVTLIAITGGEELLTKDVNRNGICDEGDTFLSMGEPFIDRNDDGTYNEGEYFLDVDGNGYRTQAHTDSYHAPYKQASDCEYWKKNTQIWKQTKFLWVGEPVYEGFMDQEGNHIEEYTLVEGESIKLMLYTLDVRFNNIGGSTLTCAYDGKASIDVSPKTQELYTHWGPSPAAPPIAITAPEGTEQEPFKGGGGMVTCTATFIPLTKDGEVLKKSYNVYIIAKAK